MKRTWANGNTSNDAAHNNTWLMSIKQTSTWCMQSLSSRRSGRNLHGASGCMSTCSSNTNKPRLWIALKSPIVKGLVGLVANLEKTIQLKAMYNIYLYDHPGAEGRTPGFHSCCSYSKLWALPMVFLQSEIRIRQGTMYDQDQVKRKTKFKRVS